MKAYIPSRLEPFGALIQFLRWHSKTLISILFLEPFEALIQFVHWQSQTLTSILFLEPFEALIQFLHWQSQTLTSILFWNPVAPSYNFYVGSHRHSPPYFSGTLWRPHTISTLAVTDTHLHTPCSRRRCRIPGTGEGRR